MSGLYGDTATPEVGSFLMSSYGYDQTNVAFWKVVALTPSGKSVRLQRWSQVRTEASVGSCDYVIPGEGPAQRLVIEPGYEDADYWTRQERSSRVDAEIVTHRWNAERGYARIDYCQSAVKWDGRAEYQTAPGWGH